MSPTPSARTAGAIRHKVNTTANAHRLGGLNLDRALRRKFSILVFISVNLVRLLRKLLRAGDRRRPDRPGTSPPVAGRLLSKGFLFVAPATRNDRHAPAHRS